MTTDIQTLFAQDPLGLSKKNLAEMVQYYRERRHQYNAGNKGAGKKQTEKQKQAEDLAEKAKLDLSDLLE